MIEDFRLKIFIELAKTGNFTRTAEALGISQPAVSQNIAELESSLGRKLVERSRHSVSLTDDGRLFLGYAQRIVYWYDRTSGIFDNGKTDSRITIASGRDMMEAVLPGILSRTGHLFKYLSVIECGMEPDADFVLETEILPFHTVPSDSSCVIGVSDPVFFVSSASASAFSGVSDYDGVRSLSLAFWSCAGDPDRILPPEMARQVVLQSVSPAILTEAVRKSASFAGILPYHLIAEDVRGGSLSILPVPCPFYKTEVRLTVKDEPHCSGIASVLRDELSSYFRIPVTSRTEL